MATRFIVRPSGISLTPNALKTALSAQQVVKASKPGIEFDPELDFFFAYPQAYQLKRGLNQGQLASYHQILPFFTSSKYTQRKYMLDAGISVPQTQGLHFYDREAGKKYVWRPSSHSAGSGFTVLSHDAPLPVGGYLSELYKRLYEYRVIYVLGKRLCCLQKSVPEGISQEVPWTFGNGAIFSDIGDRWTNHRLHSRGCYTALDAFFVSQIAHICAYDVMVSDDGYAVSECNFAPSLKVDSRIQKVANHILSVRP